MITLGSKSLADGQVMSRPLTNPKGPKAPPPQPKGTKKKLNSLLGIKAGASKFSDLRPFSTFRRDKNLFIQVCTKGTECVINSGSQNPDIAKKGGSWTHAKIC